MSTVSGKVCAITGAGAGIGREVALELARRGARVAISDVDEAGLVHTGELLAPLCSDVHQQVLDVSDRPAVEAWAGAVAARYGVVHQIYNNAGIASGHTILQSGYTELEGVIAIDLWGVIYGTKAFLPHVIASGDGHVVNTSSLNGFFAQGKLSAYVTSKFAVRGFTETLRAEMLAARSPVKVSVVHPGGVKTQISHNALANAERLGIDVTDDDRARAKLYSDKYLKMDPGQAARIIVDGVQKGRPRILVGSDAKMVDAVVRLMPATAPRLAVLFDRLTARGSSHRG
jgi:NAD(P)-dependent dehydrogenase (short-subunit alcohol dehydrogenase family)